MRCQNVAPTYTRRRDVKLRPSSGGMRARPQGCSTTAGDRPSRSGMVLGEALGRHLVRQRQADADRHGRRPVVSTLPALDNPRTVGAMDNSGVVRGAHANLLLLQQRPLAERPLSMAQL